jgi:hypothetical protein
MHVFHPSESTNCLIFINIIIRLKLTCFCACIRQTSTRVSLDVPKYPQIYPIICIKTAVQTANLSQQYPQNLLLLATNYRSCAKCECPTIILFVGTSGPRSPINYFVVTLGIIFLLALNKSHVYPLP